MTETKSFSIEKSKSPNMFFTDSLPHAHPNTQDDLWNQHRGAHNHNVASFGPFIKNAPVCLGVFNENMGCLTASDRFMEEIQKLMRFTHNENPSANFLGIRKKWSDAHVRALKGESLRCEEDWMEGPNGRIEWLKWELSPWLKDSGEVGGTVLFFEHISEKKEKEWRLESALEELRGSNRKLEKFANLCAHDLYEPLRSLESNCHFLRTEFVTTKNQQAQVCLDKISQNVQYMWNLIEGVLVYSQLENDSLDIRGKHISSQTIMNLVQIVLDKQIKERGAQIECGHLAEIYGDKTLLASILQNLMSNALKFNKNPTPFIRVSSKETGKFTTLCIEDNGIGIDKKNHKVVFEMFKRLHTTSEYRGSGIGLALCKKIMELHGGYIKIKSLPKGGTQFFLSFPKKSHSASPQMNF